MAFLAPELVCELRSHPGGSEPPEGDLNKSLNSFKRKSCGSLTQTGRVSQPVIEISAEVHESSPNSPERCDEIASLPRTAADIGDPAELNTGIRTKCSKQCKQMLKVAE